MRLISEHRSGAYIKYVSTGAQINAGRLLSSRVLGGADAVSALAFGLIKHPVRAAIEAVSILMAVPDSQSD